MLNRTLVERAGDDWDEDALRARTDALIDAVLQIWRVPVGHQLATAISRRESRARRRIEVVDLIGAGFLDEGATLYARQRKAIGRTATVLQDGSLDVDGAVFSSPSGAARSVSGTSVNGWWFWLVDARSRLSLGDLVRFYVDDLSVEVEESALVDESEGD